MLTYADVLELEKGLENEWFHLEYPTGQGYMYIDI
jgi:hypothetical protein